MKHHFFALSALLIVSSSLRAVNFDPNTRYSKELINSRMTEWNNKTKTVGFPNDNSTNGKTTPSTAASWDYVPGVVAKGILEAWSYYQDQTWAEAWYNGLAKWASGKTAPTGGGSLDDLNCAKVFFTLYDGAKAGGKFANATNASAYLTQLSNAATGLKAHKSSYSISGTGTTADGGWYHKSSYTNQMWCDGAYMGPALLAQILDYQQQVANDGDNNTNITCALTWNDVMTQFTASWTPLWDNDKKLLWHAFSTDKSSGGADGWEFASDQTPIGGGYHSAEYWSRADGWYILALVDVLEAMEHCDMKGTTNFTTIQGYLTDLATGLIARQDATTGCWYQLLQYGSDKCAKQGTDATGSSTYTNVSSGGTFCNYLESSGSCLITAALLKALRLGYLTGDTYKNAAKRGYEGIVSQFIQGTAGNYTISTSCESAGLSKDRNGSAAYYLIGRDVPVNDNTEGKVFGAFLMAAVEYERAYLPIGSASDEMASNCKCLNLTLQ